MRLVATEYLSLDGIFEEPGHWSFPFFNDEAGQFKWSELQASDALLMGRNTYAGFAAAWPKMQGAHHAVPVLGKGRRLFDDGAEKRPLKLTATKHFASGVMVLEYEAAG